MSNQHDSQTNYSLMGLVLSKDDLLIIFYVLLGASFLIVAVILIPAGTLSLTENKKVSESAATASSGDGNGSADEGSGLFKLGQVKVTLGDGSGTLDFKLVLEYSRKILRLSTDGTITNSENAEDYFTSRRAALKDRVVSQTSHFSADELRGENNIDNFQADLTSSINNVLSQKEEPVTNVYFESFMLMQFDNNA